MRALKARSAVVGCVVGLVVGCTVGALVCQPPPAEAMERTGKYTATEESVYEAALLAECLRAAGARMEVQWTGDESRGRTGVSRRCLALLVIPVEGEGDHIL
ncbi:MAG: hypothetical protein ACE5JM_07655, partial [Armatimonadota bacterium]